MTETLAGLMAELRVEITRLQQENNRLKHNEAVLLKHLRRAHEAIANLKSQAASRAGRVPR